MRPEETLPQVHIIHDSKWSEGGGITKEAYRQQKRQLKLEMQKIKLEGQKLKAEGQKLRNEILRLKLQYNKSNK